MTSCLAICAIFHLSQISFLISSTIYCNTMRYIVNASKINRLNKQDRERTQLKNPPPPKIYYLFFFFNDTATTEIYTLSLHDALPICFLISSTIYCNTMRYIVNASKINRLNK